MDTNKWHKFIHKGFEPDVPKQILSELLLDRF
jgi:hypothetical protein